MIASKIAGEPMARAIGLLLGMVGFVCGTEVPPPPPPPPSGTTLVITGPLAFTPIAIIAFRADRVTCPSPAGGAPASVTAVVLLATSSGATCEGAANAPAGDTAFLRVGLGAANAPSAPGPGTYALGAAAAPNVPTASVVVETRGQAGERRAYGTEGTVTFVESSPARLAGSLEVALDDGGSVTGTFEGVPCAPSTLLCCSPPAPGVCPE